MTPRRQIVVLAAALLVLAFVIAVAPSPGLHQAAASQGVIGRAQPEWVREGPVEALAASVQPRNQLIRFAAPSAEPVLATAAPKLLGIVLYDGRRSASLVTGQDPPVALGVGGEIGAWRVASIDAEGVMVTSGGQSLELRPFDAKPPAPGETGQKQK